MQFFPSTMALRKDQSNGDTTPYRRNVLVLTGILFVVKLILAFVLELGNDEAYYWLYSQYLQWNYFDHPPMVAVWIRLFTLNLSLESLEGFVRLGSVIGCAVSGWFLFRAVAILHSEKAGWFAVVLYNSSFYSAVTAGLYILPDSPQMVFWTLGLFLIARITKAERNWINWLLFGMAAGLCIMSKVHGAFLWIGMGGYMLFQRKAWLAMPQPYIAFLITVAVASPIFFWNLEYDFVTFRFHSSRVVSEEVKVHWNYFFKELGTQIGFNNPVNVFLVVSALTALFRKRIPLHPALMIYVLTGLSLILILLFISLFRNVTLPHWSGPAYVSLMPLAAAWLAGRTTDSFPAVLRWGLGIFLFVYLAYGLLVNYYPGTYGSHNKQDYGRGDITLDMYGWRKAAAQFDSLYKDDVAKSRMPANAAMVTSHWWGAHVEYYFARPLQLKMIGLGDPRYLNAYLWINKWRKGETDLNHAYFIIPSDDKYIVPSDHFQNSEPALAIDINRSGHLAHRFLVYRLTGLKKEVEVAQ